MEMKKLCAFALSMAVVLSLSACGGKGGGGANSGQVTGGGSGDAGSAGDSAQLRVIGGDPSAWGPAGDNVQIPNPFVDCSSLADAAAAAGFGLTAPEQAGDNPMRGIQVMSMDPKLIQIFYGDEDNEVRVRKAAGSDDISGDYNVYSQISSVEVDGVSVTEKGEDGMVMVAVWSDGGYTYAVLSNAGMGAGDVAALVQGIK